MILTGPAIAQAVAAGEIVFEPFDPAQLNPNSYNFRLGPTLIRVEQPGGEHDPELIRLSDEGFVLQPRNLYLAATQEVIGSRRYVMTLLGRSSLGRLGLFLNTTADLGHAGSESRWTLELSVVQCLRVYPGLVVGQVAFWCQQGLTGEGYVGRYHKDRTPALSRDRHLDGTI